MVSVRRAITLPVSYLPEKSRAVLNIGRTEDRPKKRDGAVTDRSVSFFEL
jgi:hypothetical protein